MIKVVAFDFGGVFGSDADEWTTTFKKVLDYSGLTEEEMLFVWEKHWPLLKINQEPIENYWTEVAKKNNADPEKIRQIYNQSIRLDTEAFNYAQSLKEKYKVVILSNDTKDWMKAKIERFGLDKVFDKIYSSADLGIAKPQQEIFEYVLKDLGISPEELLFIDNQENNIKTAKSLGITTVLFENLEQAKKEIYLTLS